MRRTIFLLLLCTSLAWGQTPEGSATPAGSESPTINGTLIVPSATPGMTPVPGATATPGQPQPPEEVKAPEDPAHNELRALRTRMQDAMNTSNIDALLMGVTDDVVFSTMNGDVVRGKDAIKEYFAKMMGGVVKSVKTNFEADDLTILYGGSLGEPEYAGVAFGHADDSYTLADGSSFNVQPRWTATMIREPDGWKVASFHYSVNVFDNPIMAKLKQSTTAIAGGAAVVGLILGLLIGFVLGRRKKG